MVGYENLKENIEDIKLEIDRNGRTYKLVTRNEKIEDKNRDKEDIN